MPDSYFQSSIFFCPGRNIAVGSNKAGVKSGAMVKSSAVNTLL